MSKYKKHEIAVGNVGSRRIDPTPPRHSETIACENCRKQVVWDDLDTVWVLEGEGNDRHQYMWCVDCRTDKAKHQNGRWEA